MKRTCILFMTLTLIMTFWCNRLDAGGMEGSNLVQAVDGDAKILKTWNGDYPVDQIKLLPEEQRENAVGYIDDAETFEGVWKAFKPGEGVPDIDFGVNLVLYARNTRFFNRISIGKVILTNGVAELLAMETMSALPIEDKVAMSMVVVDREGIRAIKAGDRNIPITKD